MTNKEKADRLLREAGEIYEGIPEFLKRGAFNIVVRRSQEVVELVLKGLLNELGIDYPKEHDVAPLFSEVVRRKKVEVKEDFLEWLKKVSADLASKRAPAFYCEMDYTNDQAEEAREWAEKVLAFGKGLMERLRG
jgi:HEPN domain-containing protein